ncbi:MAG: sialidase family protein, partial [Anaerolineales bacterium]
ENESKKLWYTLSTDGGQTYSIPTMLVSGRDVGEGTWLPRIAVDQSFTPFVAWIQAGKLVFAYTEDGGQSFIPQIIDQEVCECCPPNPVVKDDRVYIVYRDRSTDAQGRVVRGINLIFSGQGNLEFNEPVPANDAPWYLDVCPLSGPVLAIDDQRIYVAWMDGRNDKPNSLNRSDIWLAISTDGGQSFSDNIRLNVNDGVYNNKPAMVLGPDGRLHIVWEADEGDQGFVYYVTSDDGGQTLTAPVVVVANERGSEAGLPTNVRLAVDDAGRVYLMWVDKIGAHLWIW